MCRSGKDSILLSAATHFLRYIQACAASEITIDCISLQNELLATVLDPPGMLMDAVTQIVILSPALIRECHSRLCCGHK